MKIRFNDKTEINNIFNSIVNGNDKQRENAWKKYYKILDKAIEEYVYCFSTVYLNIDEKLVKKAIQKNKKERL